MGMCGGGDDKQESTSYQTNLPEYAEPYFKDLMARAQEESVKSYQAYGGDRISGFDPAQTAAQTSIEGMGAPTQLTQATAGLSDAQKAAAASSYAPTAFTSGYTAGSVKAPQWDAATASKYMSPYQQAVVDIEKREARRQGAQEQLDIAAQASKANAFGGARHGVVEAEQRRNLSQQLADIQTKGSQRAYEQAASQFAADRTAQMEADKATEGFQQFAAQQGMTAQQQAEASKQFAATFQQQKQQIQTQVAQAQQSLGAAQQELDLARYKAQNAIGAEQQALAQKELDQKYQDFVNKRDYERQQLAFYNSLMRGIPVPVQQETIAYKPQPSLAGQIGGLGLAGLGMFNASGRGGHIGGAR